MTNERSVLPPLANEGAPLPPCLVPGAGLVTRPSIRHNTTPGARNNDDRGPNDNKYKRGASKPFIQR